MYWILLLLFCSVTLVNGDQKEISLNGEDWSLSDEAGKVKNLPATVPGIVHMDLLRGKVIEDPYYGFNDQNQQWVAYSNWTYSLNFKMSSDDIKGKDLVLKCDGIDTVAHISLNGIPVGYTYNYYRKWLFDVTEVVKDGDNILEVKIEAAANYSTRLSQAYPYSVPAPGTYIPDTSRNFIRKPQSDFGWDWGPAFVPAGIWQNISIVSYDRVLVTTIVPKPFYCNNRNVKDSYMIEVLVCVDTKKAGDNYDVSVSLTVPGTPFETVAKWTNQLHANQTGETCFRMMTNPVESSKMDQYLWKPRSSSSPTPLLYSATVTVNIMSSGSSSNAAVSTVSLTRRIGFRNIVIKQDPVKDGELFYFQQSDSSTDYPIYAKGSNFIPMDAFISRATPEVARRLLVSAVEGNQNMIRIWGGGLYQPNWFYDMCDEMGILVWQEFMFAVALYPRNTEFLENIRMEVIDTVRRLGYHPSIVLWSGNNENQGFCKKTADYIDYSLLYDSTIRATLWEEDTTRHYWPSSPSNGAVIDDKELGVYVQRWGDSQDVHYGDIHRYDYFDLCTNVSTFPRPHFASEFGFQSYPSIASLRKVSKPSDWNNNSTLMNHRQHHPDGNEQLLNMMRLLFKIPKNSNETVQFEDFVYMTQVVQSVCITAEAEHYRRILTEDGYTRGTLYWQLNDIWQAQSWASVEYGGRWKLLHYGMKKVYAELLVSAFQLGDSVFVYVTNDQAHTETKFDLSVSTIKWKDGSTVKTFTSTDLLAVGYTGSNQFSKKISEVFVGTSIQESFLYITATQTKSNVVIAEGTFFPYNFSLIDLPKAKILISDEHMIDSMTVKFNMTSSAVAPYLYLDSGDINGYFSDNGMLVMPSKQYTMTFTGWAPFTVDQFKSNIKTRSVRDTYP